MAHIGEENAFGLVGRLGRAECEKELGGALIDDVLKLVLVAAEFFQRK